MVDGPPVVSIGAIGRMLGVVVTSGLADTRLVDLVNGAEVTEPGQEATEASWRLTISDGPDALQTRCVENGGMVVIGRAGAVLPETDGTSRWEINDATLSARHCVVSVEAGEVVVRDLGSTNGTLCEAARRGTTRRPIRDTDDCGPLVDGLPMVVHLGSTTMEVRPIGPAPRRSGEAFDAISGTFEHRRRPAPSTRAVAIDVPAVRTAGRARIRVRPGAFVGPIVGAAAMALLFDPKFAAFALLSPVLLLVNLLDDRRSAGRERRTGERDFTAAFDEFVARVRTQIAQTSRERHDEFASLADVFAGVDQPSSWWRSAPADGDPWLVRLGSGPQRTVPVLRDHGPRADAVSAALESLVVAVRPTVVDIGPGSIVAIVGPGAAAAARAVVLQALARYGPSALSLVVDGGPEWATWCPHHRVAPAMDRHTLFVQLCGGEAASSVRRRMVTDGLARGPIAILVAVDRLEQVPVDATTVVELGDGPAAFVRDLVTGEVHHEVLVDGVGDVAAAVATRAMSQWREPAAVTVAELDSTVSLGDVLDEVGAGAPQCPLGSSASRRRWEQAPRDQRSLEAVLGIGADGVRIIDFVADGPHALIAGTTGSGKSELLRTLISGLAARYGPDLVTFVLVDYKGGSAFAECASFPHTVGFVTDLDDGLAERALVCLEAELRARELVLREYGARDLIGYASVSGRPPLPRLLVVIDELAALVRDLPGFVSALVSLAQRGRSLGLHLVLATQRPAGTINDAIRANTNIRIALRVQDVADAVDVIGQPDAAFLDRRVPGRAYVRLGPGDVSAFQVACVGAEPLGHAVIVTTLAGEPIMRQTTTADIDEPDEMVALRPLARLAAGLSAAAKLAEIALPRRPWPDPLPCVWTSTLPQWRVGIVGLADRPADQWQGPFVVDLAAGNIAVVGAVGSGVTTTLRSIALALAAAPTDGGRWLFVLDLLGRDLEGLVAVGCVGAVVGPHEEERRERLVAMIDREVSRRRGAPPDEQGPPPTEWVVLVDGWSALRTGAGDASTVHLSDTLTRLVVEGGAVGIRFVLGSDRASSLPSAIGPSIGTRLILAPADAHEAATSGVRFVPSVVGIAGRALVASSPGVQVQLALSGPDDVGVVASLIEHEGSVRRPPPSVSTLPNWVPLATVMGAPVTDLASGTAWRVPFAVSGRSMEVAELVLRPGEPVLVVGPMRSGRSTALATIATSALAVVPGLRAAFVRPGEPSLTAFRADLESATVAGAALLVLIDDAERVHDVDGLLAGLMTAPNDRVRVVVAGRADALRSAYGHWSSPARRTRHGLALQPTMDTDGELWSTPFPRRLRLRGGAGRAILLSDSEIEVVQVASG